jgi:hypothetical protein
MNDNNLNDENFCSFGVDVGRRRRRKRLCLAAG